MSDNAEEAVEIPKTVGVNKPFGRPRTADALRAISKARVSEVREILEKSHFSVLTLAKEIGLRRTALSHILNGRTNFAEEVYVKAINALNAAGVAKMEPRDMMSQVMNFVNNHPALRSLEVEERTALTLDMAEAIHKDNSAALTISENDLMSYLLKAMVNLTKKG